jgi:hypothetical protein
MAAALAASTVAGMAWASASAAATLPESFPLHRTVYLPAPAPPKGAEIVYLGIEPLSYDNVNVSQDSFDTSFYIWWRWRGKIDPVTTTDVLNSNPSSSSYVIDYSYVNAAGTERPIKLPDGERYQTARISLAVSAPFPVNRYPLDHQNLVLRFEDNTWDDHQLVYVPDRANMTTRPAVEVSGWNVTGESIGTLLHRYGTNFGAVGTGLSASNYSQLVYDVKIERPPSHFLLKLFLPLLVVFIAATSALFIKKDDSDIRLAMVGTGLLTVIFLQFGYSGDLPPTAPAVLMDEIYVAAYVGLGLTFLRVIYTTNQIRHQKRAHEELITGDRIFAGIVWGSVAIAIALLIAL